jgi:hypothetical protein
MPAASAMPAAMETATAMETAAVATSRAISTVNAAAIATMISIPTAVSIPATITIPTVIADAYTEAIGIPVIPIRISIGIVRIGVTVCNRGCCGIIAVGWRSITWASRLSSLIVAVALTAVSRILGRIRCLSCTHIIGP